MGLNESLSAYGRHLILMDHDFTAAETIGVDGAAVAFPGAASYLAFQAVFTYVADAATSAKAYIQTSLDAGATWFDIASFAFTTSTATKVSAVTTEIAPASQAFTPADGTLSDNTIIQGIIGDRLRVKFVSVGAYGAGSNLRIDAWVKKS